MSSILKALRKIEEEKRAAENQAPDLRVDHGAAPDRGNRFLPLLSGVAIGAVLVSLFFYWSSRGPATPVASVPRQITSEPAAISPQRPSPPVIATTEQPSDLAGTVAPATPLERPAVVEAAASAEMVKSVPVTAPLDVTAANQATPVQPPSVIDVKSPAQTAVKAVPAAEHGGAGAVPALREEPATAVNVGSPPEISVTESQKRDSMAESMPGDRAASVGPDDAGKPADVTAEALELPVGVALRVSDVFYQEDSANSMAVVNDLPVMVGTRVESALVKEIRPDSVLFQIGEQSYLVFITPP